MRRAEHLLSRSRTDLLGKNHWEEYSATIGTIIEREYRRAVAEQVTVEFENYSKRWHRWLEFKAYPAAHGLSVYFRDITDRKRAEEASRRSEQELSDFFETATIGLHWVGPDGVILRVNQAELDLLGYNRDEYIGHHIAEFHADPPVIEDILELPRQRREAEGLSGPHAVQRPFDQECAYRLQRVVGRRKIHSHTVLHA